MKREVEGWNGTPLRQHVETAQSTADEARQIAADALALADECDEEQATLSARMDELERRLSVSGGLKGE